MQTTVDKRTAKLKTILAEANAAIEEKSGSAAEELALLPEAIKDIPVGEIITWQSLSIKPNAAGMKLNAAEGYGFRSVQVTGDEDLTGENLRRGVNIFGVEGLLDIGLQMPEEYSESYSEAEVLCRENFSDFMSEEWAHTFIQENDTYIIIGFAPEEGISVTDYNAATGEFVSSGWVGCTCHKNSGELTALDCRQQAVGGYFAEDIKYSDFYIQFNDLCLFPVGTITVTAPESEPVLEDKTITANGTYSASYGYDGLGTVTVDVSGGASAITNGISYDKFNSAGKITEATVYGSTVREYALYYQKALKKVTLSPDVTSIGDNAFASSPHLDFSAGLPDGVTTIGQAAFQNCAYLILNSLPSKLTTVGAYAFRGCASFGVSELPAGLTNVGAEAFVRTNLTISNLPEGITSIPLQCFGECNALTSMTFHAKVTQFDNYAFHACEALSEVTFEGTPTSIAAKAFYVCNNLTTINVPWAEGEVANAPWGATNATINYNYTGE